MGSVALQGFRFLQGLLHENPILVFRPLYESAILRFRRTNKSVTFRYPVSIRTLNFEESFSLRWLRFELSACRNTALNFELCCVVRVSAFPRFGECCVARFSSTHSILSALYFSSPSTTSAILRWLVMLVLSNLYRCMFIEFYFLSKYSNSIKRLTHKRNGKGCPSAASQENIMR